MAEKLAELTSPQWSCKRSEVPMPWRHLSLRYIGSHFWEDTDIIGRASW